MLQVQILTLGLYETNCYILYDDTRQDCLVIDPGYEPEKVMETVRSLGKSVTAVLLTHGHFDHVGGVRSVFADSDCDIYLCPDDCKMPEMMTAGPLCYTHSLQNGDVLTLCGLKIEVLHTPGHTPGSVCFFVEDKLFSGDTLFAGSCGRTDLPCGDWDTLNESLHKLKNLTGDYTVYPGHGEETKLSVERMYNPYLR